MADEPNKSGIILPTLLTAFPRSDPAVIKAAQDARLGNIHYSAIGQVAAAWGYLEALIDTWLATFADVEPGIGLCFTAQMIDPRPRIDAFIALCRHLGADKRWNKKLESFAADATKLAERRNRALHDVWDIREPEQPHRIEATARRAVRILRIHVPTRDLLALTEEIYKMCSRFHDEIANPLFTELRTLPDTSQ